MTIPIPDFWRLVIESQLLPAEECQRLGQQFGHVKGAAAQGNARTLSEWLISQNVISRYQSTILLGGRAGPFVYGDYKIYDRAEGGPLAGQFKAVHSITGHPVLLKFFAGEAVSDPQRWVSVVQRAHKHTSLNHPHWWRSFEVADLEQFKFIAVADVAGESVAQRLASGGRMPWPEAFRIIYQAMLALARAHESGFVHGSVRPNNIMLDQQGRAVLWCDPAASLTPINTHAADDDTVLRAEYAAPELATGASPQPLSDIYAMGCTLYQMLSGEAPFSGGNVQMKMQRHASEAIQPLSPLGVSEQAAKTVAYMMAKNASVRYQTASQAADQLGQLLESSARQPQVAPAPATLAALEQFVKQKPKAAPVSPVRQAPASPVGVAAPAGGSNSPVPVSSPVNPAVPVNTAAVGAATGTAVASGVSVSSRTTAPVSTPSASERFNKKKPLSKNKPLLIMAGCGLAFLLTLGILAASGTFSGDGDDVAQSDDGDAADGAEADGSSGDGVDVDGTQVDGTDPDGSSADGEEPADGTPPAGDPPRFNVVAIDDGSSLWAPPSTGEPVELAYVPTGARAYLIARPSEMLASTYGKNALKALGPDFQSARQQWERSVGVTLDEVEHLVIGIFPNNSQMPRFSHTVTLTKPVDMKVRWGNPSGSGDVFDLAGRKAWVPPSGGGRVFVIGSNEEIGLLTATGIPKPRAQLDPYFNQLVRSSNSDQHFIAIFDPQFFHTDGRDMFRGSYERMIEPLDWFFGDNTKAMVSLNFADDFYGELRLYSRLQKTPADMREEYGGRLDELPNKLKRYTLSLNPPSYWKELWFNFPDMVNIVKTQTRRGLEGDEAVFNFALPGHAAPNLIAASELSIATAPGATYNTGGNNPPPTKAKPKTLDELLAAKVDLGFPQQSLEFSMRDLVAAAKDEYTELPFDFQIKIIGADLQKEGITRNQQIRDFDAKATPVKDILTQLVRKANPVTTVTSPSEVDQKLVWLTGPDPDDASKTIVLITTRTAATEKKLTLPGVFVPN